MVRQPPKIDPRTASDIEQQVRELLKIYLQDATSHDLENIGSCGISLALIKVFSRYCEIIIERLNRVPQKHLLKFLDLLGASRRPPLPATVPLTFALAKGSKQAALIPMGTQVATQRAAYGNQPVVFETDHDLLVIPIKLEYVFLGNSKGDPPQDVSNWISVDSDESVEIFPPNQSMTPLSSSWSSVYLGLSISPDHKNISDGVISMYVYLDEPKFDEGSNKQVQNQKADINLLWEVFHKDEWVQLPVIDESMSFTRSGIIRFMPPKDIVSQRISEWPSMPSSIWLRVGRISGALPTRTRLKRIEFNTVMATQALTIRSEILGSSDGSPDQKFRTAQKPVLQGQKLEVREPELPTVQDIEPIQREEGSDVITPIGDSMDGVTKGCWVRWHEVPDFYASEASSRHYVLNHITGEIFFGNGRSGMIPPLSRGNIRMSYYQTGGGAAGNLAAGTITQLKTTIPFIDQVSNLVASTGGTDAEVVDSVIERVPRQLRHRDRAVTIEDYEDLAKEASADVARAKCIPREKGIVDLLIVPQSIDAMPQPSLELMGRVRDFIEARVDPTIRIKVVGPSYATVTVEATLILANLENATYVRGYTEKLLKDFLHPLTGGFDGKGWDFGRRPYDSDFYRLLQGAPGVDHVEHLHAQFLSTANPDDRSDVNSTKLFLIHGKDHKVNVKG